MFVEKKLSILQPQLLFKNQTVPGYRWLTPVLLTTWKADIRRISVQGK
jgi:hypothetical protein